MFTIIGGDNQPYGPSSTEEIRDWLKQGRANGGTLAQKDGGVWQPLASFPEFADLVHTPGALPSSPSAPPTPDEILARDYEIDIGAYLKRSWEIVQQNFWPVVGISFVVIAAILSLGHFINMISEPAMNELEVQHKLSGRSIGLLILSSLISGPLDTVLIAGLYRYYIKLIRGEEAGIGDAFSGFTHSFVPLVLLWLAQSVLMCVGFVLCILPAIYLSVAWFFAVPLVIDRDMRFCDAMKLSLKTANKHWFMMLALLTVASLVACCGILVFCLGIFVSIPVGYLMLMIAYEDIFNRRAR